LALLFADDTTLYLSDSNFDRLIQKVNSEFKKITDFFRAHKLALHPEKTKFMVFSNNADVRNQDVVVSMNFNNNEDPFPCASRIHKLSRVTTNDTTPGSLH
jgi:hypothetical protein